MKSAHQKLSVDLIGAAPMKWSLVLEQVCLVGITPFFVADATARTGP